MTSETAAQIEELEDILDRERLALLKGDLSSLERFVSQKGALIGQIRGSRNNIESIRELKRKLARNRQLLDGAMSGVRTVAVRLEQLKRARSGLETYDRAGRRNTVSTTPGKGLEKRA